MTKIVLRAFVLILCAVPAMAKEPSPHSAQQAVANTLQQLHQAMIDASSADLYKLTVEELTYGHSTGQTDDRKTFIEGILTGKPDYKAIEFQDPTIVVKKNIAWVRGNFQAEVLSATGTDRVAFKMLYVFVQENGAWKLLVRQSLK
jgi:hypothetical protein